MGGGPESRESAEIAYLTAAINARPSDEDITRLYVERGRAYEKMGDEVNAVRDYLTALDTASKPSHIANIKAKVALALATKVEQHETAVFWAVSAFDQDPDSADICHALGVICCRYDLYNMAMVFLQKSIQIEPGRRDSVLALGKCQIENCQRHDAIKTLTEYVANYPDDAEGLYNLAWAHNLNVEDVQIHLHVAKELYERVLKLDPKPLLRTIVERKLKEITEWIKNSID